MKYIKIIFLFLSLSFLTSCYDKVEIYNADVTLDYCNRESETLRFENVYSYGIDTYKQAVPVFRARGYKDKKHIWYKKFNVCDYSIKKYDNTIVEIFDIADTGALVCLIIMCICVIAIIIMSKVGDKGDKDEKPKQGYGGLLPGHRRSNYNTIATMAALNIMR